MSSSESINFDDIVIPMYGNYFVLIFMSIFSSGLNDGCVNT